MHELEFFFDCSSPWTFLAFENIQGIADREDVQFVWKPILVGGVFNAVNESVYETRANPVPAKARYYQKDLQDWARYTGINIGQPPVFPVNSVKAMRGAFVAMEHDCIVPYARRVFHHYWTELEDISQEDLLRDIAVACGIEPGRILRQDRLCALQGQAQALHPGADRPRWFRLTNNVRQW